MKIAHTTKKAMMETMETENLLAGRTFVDEKEPVKEANLIGVCKTAKGNFMVYLTNESGKMTKTSVHTNRREANGMVIRRLRETVNA